jgi:hypothetical protein
MLDLRIREERTPWPFLEGDQYEKSLARGRFGSCRIVTDHSDYGSLILAANVSVGSGPCCDAGNEREVPVGLIPH